MPKHAIVSRFRFALVALLIVFACASLVGCAPDPAQQRAAIAQVNARLIDCFNRFEEKIQAQNRAQALGDESDSTQILSALEKIASECSAELRAIDASGCPSDYQAGLKKVGNSIDALCAYLAKLTSGKIKDSPSIQTKLQDLLVEFALSCEELDQIKLKYSEPQ